jgi:hypothetical protein
MVIYKPEKFPKLEDFTYRQVKKFLHDRSQLVSLTKGQTFLLPGGGILWWGELVPIKERELEEIKKLTKKERKSLK